MALEEALDKGHKFSVTVDDKLNWLTNQLNQLSKTEPLSADKDILAKQTLQHEVCIIHI